MQEAIRGKKRRGAKPPGSTMEGMALQLFVENFGNDFESRVGERYEGPIRTRILDAFTDCLDAVRGEFTLAAPGVLWYPSPIGEPNGFDRAKSLSDCRSVCEPRAVPDHPVVRKGERGVSLYGVYRGVAKPMT